MLQQEADERKAELTDRNVFVTKIYWDNFIIMYFHRPSDNNKELRLQSVMFSSSSYFLFLFLIVIDQISSSLTLWLPEAINL